MPNVPDHSSRVERIAYSPAEAADALGCTRSHIYNLIARGEIRRHKVGGLTRIAAADLRALVGGDRDV